MRCCCRYRCFARVRRSRIASRLLKKRHRLSMPSFPRRASSFPTRKSLPTHPEAGRPSFQRVSRGVEPLADAQRVHLARLRIPTCGKLRGRTFGRFFSNVFVHYSSSNSSKYPFNILSNIVIITILKNAAEMLCPIVHELLPRFYRICFLPKSLRR